MSKFGGVCTASWDSSTVTDTLHRGVTNAWLRERLKVPADQPSDLAVPEKSGSLSQLMMNAVSTGLIWEAESEEFRAAVTALFDRMVQEYRGCAIPANLRKRQFIARSGLVMAPDQCITTLLDYSRIRAFWRACDQAIWDQLADGKPTLHIVYPACGPFAPLLLPLLTYYHHNRRLGPDQLQVVLIDMQPGAVVSLKHLVDHLDLGGHITEIHCGDACDYQPCQPLDILLLEAMQHGFSREGHFAIARHFSGYMAPTGILLPERIIIRAVITEGQREFVDQWRASDGSEKTEPDSSARAARHDLGLVFCLTLASLREIEDQRVDEYTRLIPCNEIELPALPDHIQNPLLLICSELHLYRGEKLDEYDSGITHPLPDFQVCINFEPRDRRSGDLVVRTGHRLKFYYCQNGLPGFLATCVPRDISESNVAEEGTYNG